MNKYKKIKKLDSSEFKRLTGVQPETFQEMLKVLKNAEILRRSRGGKSHRLKLADRLDLLRNSSHLLTFYQLYGTVNKVSDSSSGSVTFFL